MAKESRQRITSPTAILFDPLFVSDHWFFFFRSELVSFASLEQQETLGTSSGQWLWGGWVVKVIRWKLNVIPSPIDPVSVRHQNKRGIVLYPYTAERIMD